MRHFTSDREETNQVKRAKINIFTKEYKLFRVKYIHEI